MSHDETIPEKRDGRKGPRGPRLPKGPSVDEFTNPYGEHDPQSASEMAAPVSALPSFSIAERRAQNGDLKALAEPDPEVLLIRVHEPMTTRWIYIGEGAPIGRFHEVTERKGWVQVARRHIKGDPKLYGWITSPDGFITRGQKGEEVLVMMPARLARQIHYAKTAANDKKRRSIGALKQTVQSELSAAGNDRGAAAVGRMEVLQFEESSTSAPIVARS